MSGEPKKIDLASTKSSHRGIKGLFETLLRKFPEAVQMVITLPLLLVGGAVLGLAVTPVIFLFRWTMEASAELSFFWSCLSWGVALGCGFYVFALTLLTVVPLVNRLMMAWPKPWRGPYYSVEAIGWYIHNGLTYLVRYAVLEFLTPSPFSVIFYRAMKMKIGNRCQINTTQISDPCLITLGNKVTLGGSATIVAHYGQGGLLILAPVEIGDGVTIGLKATIMGGVVIGANAKVLPHSVVLPKTKIGPGEVWGGIPARKISLQELEELRSAS
jgi:acetyltransferase-like isoleucine patch superfamily enzyme